MSVTAQTPYNGYTANGATTVFPYGFLLLDTDDLTVTVDGVEKALTTDYTVSGLNNPSGGNVTFLVAPADTTKVLLSRLLTIQRLTDYQDNGDLFAATINQDLDRLWLALQQLQQNDIRALKLPYDTSTDQVLTQDAAARANKGIRFDASGNMIISTYDPDGAQASAAASASAASSSASSASGSASSASASASTATTQAGIATTQAANAAASAASVGFTLTSTSTFQNKTMTAAGGNSVEATSGPGASQFSLRNKIINGGMQIIQRGAVALSATANTTYCADRITVQAAGGTGLAGNGANATSGGNTRSGYIAGAMACNWTNATMKVQTRLEDVNVIALNSKTVTVSGRLYHDIGSSRTCQVVIQKANSANNFSGVTTLGTSATFAAASGAYTSFSYTLALGGSDATNGLLISVEDTATSTATGKTFAVGDFQLEEGATATPFEVRPVGIELPLCQRYYETSTRSLWSGQTTSGNPYYLSIPFKAVKRIAPTGATVASAGAAGFPATASTFNTGNAWAFELTRTANATTASGIFADSWSVDVEL
jgi:hypothetical protein